MRGACIEKALSWGDERLMRTFVWSLNLFNISHGIVKKPVAKSGQGPENRRTFAD